ncbi:MAG: hypothetical protein JWM76_26 [Pseudonocardiales bacterium]|nr:hypothetical protein [Pseudonocardiales bacterium]
MGQLTICQIALCTLDLPATARTLTDGLGFAAAGGRQVWGERLGLVQSLPTGAASACSVWWLVGRQQFLQLELFHHTVPAIAPRSRGWAEDELGWNRWSVAVLDFDAVVERLGALGVLAEDAEVLGVAGRRWLRFVEPGTQVCIDVEEERPGSPMRNEEFPLSPRITGVTLNVADLGPAIELFKRLGFDEVALDERHRGSERRPSPGTAGRPCGRRSTRTAWCWRSRSTRRPDNRPAALRVTRDS